MLEIRPFGDTNHQIGSHWGWKSSKTTCAFLKKKVVFRTTLEQMFKCTATNLNTQPTMMRQTDAWLKVPGCCCLSDMGSKILFRIDFLPPLMIAGLRRGDLWLGLLGYWTLHKWTSSYGARFTRCQLILKRILFPISLRQQRSNSLESQISLCCVVCCVSRPVAVCLDITLNLYEMQLQNTLAVLLDFQP